MRVRSRRPVEPPEARPDASLLRKYQDLLRKHEQLTEKLRMKTLERTAIYRLSWWALQTISSGLAIIADQRLLVSNPRWNQLQASGRDIWVTEGASGKQASPRSLHAIATEAAAAITSSERALKLLRLARTDSPQRIELRLDLVPHRPPMVVLLARDVTHEREAEVELSRAREALSTGERLMALGELLAGVTHDLSSTLAAMRLRLQMLEADPELMLRHARDLQALEQIVSDAVSRVSHLHALVRRRPRGSPVEAVPLTPVVADAIDLARTEIEAGRQGAARVQIRSNLGELPAVRVDPAELRFVLINLLLNARDAMPEGGLVEVSSEVAEDCVRIRVEDQGVGFSPEARKRLFQPFFTTKGAQGSGMGLAMARNVMQRLGGSITADNREQGGAVITLTFPRADEKRRTRGEAKAGTKRSRAKGSAKRTR